ncbi:MAG: hypothetical protein LBM59_01455 [Ruminococcus sp.]|jgi:hypothetical protein|nr:hypothetical protein [Ruminococcus sp.]
MGLFSWTEPDENGKSSCEDIAELKKIVIMLSESFNRRALTIEGCVTNLLKLYQIQNMDIANLRRELLSFASQTADKADAPAEDMFIQANLSYPTDEDIKKAFVFSKTPGSSEYYKTVIHPAIRHLPHSVSFYVRLEDLFSSAGSSYAPYKAFLRDRYIDYLIYDESQIICAVIIPHEKISATETKKYLDFVERLLSIFDIPLLYNPTLEELRDFFNTKKEET